MTPQTLHGLKIAENFNENLAQLPRYDDVARLDLFRLNGDLVGCIENKPGQAGSTRVYAWLNQVFGSIDPTAAQYGLKIYAEHTLDAQSYPDKHPNIDRLLRIKVEEDTLHVKAIFKSTAFL